MFRLREFVIGTLLLIAGTLPLEAQWVEQPSGTRARLRGLSVVSPRVAWCSGAQGTILRTTDGGAIWRLLTVPDASDLDFRDLHAQDDRTAIVLAIGAGERSRIYRTTDGGATWSLRFVNPYPTGFLDALAFWDAESGLALGDPLDGRFLVLTTDDGGQTWRPVSTVGLPPALPGEGAFAASGTCLVARGNGRAWFGTGGAGVARVFRSEDYGRTWTAHETPIRAGNASSGIFSLAFADDQRGVAVGGDYQRPDQGGQIVALTDDAGRTWRPPSGREPAGFRSAVVRVPGILPARWIVAGPSGTDQASDDGVAWTSLGALGFHALGSAGPGAIWGVGEAGRIAKWVEIDRP